MLMALRGQNAQPAIPPPDLTGGAEHFADPHIRLDDVTMQYGAAPNAVLALQAANLEIGRGEP